MNKVILKGRLVRPIKQITTDKGTDIGFITLAVWRGKKDGQDLGADFFDVTLTGQNLKNFTKLSINKGSLIEIEGKLFKHKSRTNEYEQIKISMWTFNLIQNYKKREDDEDIDFLNQDLFEQMMEEE